MCVWPQFILYTPEEAARLASMQKRGVVPFDQVAVLYALGRYTLLRTASPSDLLPFLSPGAPPSRTGAFAPSGGARPPA